MLQVTQIQATVIAAIIGAVSALTVVVVKDLIIEGKRQKRREKRELLERRLTQVYSPLWVNFGGDDGVLSNIMLNNDMRNTLSSNFNLLSPELQSIIGQSLLIGRQQEDGRYYLTSSDLDGFLELTPKFKEYLKRDIAKLQVELIGEK